ncbi:MAG: hypothetical protein PWR20_984 [Bacteroidales bacterium]|jgi:hypothetical protein|nr:hypothetical protein [Bacteroidales bacterium]MDN5329957.1 hypothetical protein [Bacteroidales bacterium]NLH53271.1 hypothetical protein [Bacteroidales bacterium]NPV36898.1 hypothetical protein [Bacteroidales bacterium]
MKMDKLCQSCGLPLEKDPLKGGTHVDGSQNPKYCSYCYQNGEFTFKGTVKEFQAFVMQKMREQGHSWLKAWLLTRSIPYYERWKKN